MKKINELLLNNIINIDTRILSRFTSSIINLYNDGWEVCDIIFDQTYESYKPNINKETLYNFFNEICNDLNKNGKDCNYNVYIYISKLLNIDNFENLY